MYTIIITYSYYVLAGRLSLSKMKYTESLLLKFRIIIREPYVPVLLTGSKIVISRHKESTFTFIKV